MNKCRNYLSCKARQVSKQRHNVICELFLIVILLLSGSIALVTVTTARVVSASPASTAKELNLDLGNNAAIKLVLIPPGKFAMGSPMTEKRYDVSSEVAHDVTLSKPFFMGTTHVTVDQFAAFVKDSSYQTEAEKDGRSSTAIARGGKIEYDNANGVSWRNPGYPQQGSHPAVHLSWNDTHAFCQWLSKKSGKDVRLPTEAQWEYACRAGTKTAFPWGDDPAAGAGWANCADQTLKKEAPGTIGSPAFSWDDKFVYTSPVGTFKPNTFGLYDMIGNAYQWCNDYYDQYPKEPAVDPTGPAAGNERVLRGSSWMAYPSASRSASRYHLVNGHSGLLGFRIIVTPVD